MDARTTTHVAVVGYGYWGSKHVRVLGGLSDVEVTVVDPDPDRLMAASAHHPSARVALHLESVLEDVDAVVVATPPTTHFAVARQALTANRPVLIEKPISTTVPEAEELVALAAERGLVLMAGHTFEYNPAVRKLREIVRSGELGRILYIDSARLNLGLYRSDVNVIWDLAPHDISIASYLLDADPMACTVWARRNIAEQHADVAYLRLEFPSTHVFVHVSWLNPGKVRRTTVVGERRMAVYDDLSDNERIRIFDIGVDASTVDGTGSTGDMPVTYRTGDIVSPYVPFREPLQVQDEHFVHCVRTGARPDTPGERGLEVVRVLAATEVALGAPGAATVGPLQDGAAPGRALVPRPGPQLGVAG